MSTRLALAVALGAGAGVLACVPPGPARLRALAPPPGRATSADRSRAGAGAVGAALLLGVGVAVLVGGPAGVLLGAVASAMVWPACRWLLAREPAAEGIAPTVVPPVLDLLAACLAAGATLDDAMDAARHAARGPLADLLGAAREARALGATVPEAFGTGLPDGLGAAVRLLDQAEGSGLSVSEGLARLAERERHAARAAATSEARRVGVLAVVPLGLCFLPAFVLVGVVPLVAGAAVGLLR